MPATLVGLSWEVIDDHVLRRPLRAHGQAGPTDAAAHRHAGAGPRRPETRARPPLRRRPDAEDPHDEEQVTHMPTGRIKFYDSTKGFGFAQTDEGEEVHVPASALPAGVTELRGGTRVEFGVAEGRRGKQALSRRVRDAAPSVVRNHRPGATEMAVLMEDLITWLDQTSNGLRRGRYPQRAQAQKMAQVLRRVADDLEA